MQATPALLKGCSGSHAAGASSGERLCRGIGRIVPACASWLWQCGSQNRTIKAQQRLASQWLPSHMPSSQGPSLVWMYWMLSNLQCALCQVVIDITYRQACWKAALLALVQMHWMYWMLSNLLQCRVPAQVDPQGGVCSVQCPTVRVWACWLPRNAGKPLRVVCKQAAGAGQVQSLSGACHQRIQSAGDCASSLTPCCCRQNGCRTRSLQLPRSRCSPF